jgi:Pentapeptide repeats (9 copies)
MPNTQMFDQKVVSEPAVNQITKTLSRLVGERASLLCFLACLALLQAEVAIADEPDESYPAESEIRKQVMEQMPAAGPATPSARYDLVRGTFLSDLIKQLSLSEKPAQAQIRISSITVEGEVRLTNLEVWSTIRFEACTFRDRVFLKDTAFRRGLSCHICTFEGPVSFEGVKAEGSADFEYAKFNDSVTFKDASIGGDLRMIGSLFKSTADFTRLHLGSDLCLDEATFLGPAFFNHGSLKFLLMGNTSFRRTGEINFDNLKLGEDALVRAFFCRPVRWNYAEAKGIYYKGSRFYKSFGFNSNKASNSISFQDTDFDGQFVCRENKIGDDLDIHGAHFKSIKFLSKSQTADTSGKRDELDSRFDADFSRTKVGGIARFNRATFDGSVSLERIDFRDLDITDIKLPTKKRTTHSSDATVKYFHAGPVEEAKTLLTFVDNAEYDEGLYIGLEQFLKGRADLEQADAVFIRGQERAKDERLQPFSFAWIRSWILDVVTAYGRQPGRTLAAGAGVVLVGAIVFWRKEDMEVTDRKFEGRKYNPIWYSFDLFVPVIQVEAASVWAPKPDKLRKWLYLRIHRLLGWILVPIAIVAITGLLQGSTS